MRCAHALLCGPVLLLCPAVLCCQVVQPLFFFLAEQIDLAGQQAEEEPALRIAYDDVNENACSPEAVYRLVSVLQQQYSAPGTPAGQQPAALDLWQALQQASLWSLAAVMRSTLCGFKNKLQPAAFTGIAVSRRVVGSMQSQRRLMPQPCTSVQGAALR